MAGKFSLKVPLDASGIQDLKPDKAVKVVAFNGKGAVQEAVVRLTADKKGSADFSFDAKPGLVRVIVGPEEATADELKVLQTISVSVSPRSWGTSDKLTISPVVITARYWLWWLTWCRKFTIRGRVVCADGSAVPGADVCAFDVDWWWWWVSEDLVGCATTDSTGAFEISFRWCCGWWPWWWWARRIWRLEPLLVQRIVPVLQQSPTIPHVPMPDPAPDLAIFDAILGGFPPVPSSAMGLQADLSRPRILTATKPNAVDPTALTAIRSRLLAVLPASAEMAQLRVWPWWPWEPWYDCDPDVIFKVTQNCSGESTVIVDETVSNTRWNIAPTSDVTLVANEEACCIKPCTDPQDCPDGDCLVITDICDDNVGVIGGNPGAPVNPKGYLNPGTGDRPYAGNVPIFGIFGAAATADYYAFEYRRDGTATWNVVPPGSMGGFSCRFWGPALPAGPVGWHTANFFPVPMDGHLVIESRAHFEASNDPASWGVTRFWDSGCERRLMNWHTDGPISDGTYHLRVRSWSLVGGHLQNETVLPLCDTTDENGVTVTLDNQVVTALTGPSINLDGYPCGEGSVHQCTIEPDTAFVAVRINGQQVDACAIVDASKGGTLEIDFVAYDPDGHLAYYELDALFGDSGVRYLVPGVKNLPTLGSLSAGPATGTVPSCGSLVGWTYGKALAQGAVSPNWHGGVITFMIPLQNAFPIRCCYTLRLIAHKRTIVNCDDSFWGQYNTSDFSLTVDR